METVRSRDYQLEYASCEQEIKARANEAPDRWLRTKIFYRCYVAVVFALAMYALVKYPLLTMVFLVFCYLVHHLCFMLYHSSLHAQFMEMKHEQLLTGPFIAFVHHYVNPRLLCCFVHRATYQSMVVLISLLPIFAVALFVGGGAVLPFVVSFLLWHLTPAPIHEWYHMPPKQRRDYFNAFEYAVFSLFERCKLISTRRHLNHHRHQMSNLEDVVEFDDMNVGKTISRLFDALWHWCLRVVYRPNKKNMTLFYSGLYLFTVVVASVVAVEIVSLLNML